MKETGHTSADVSWRVVNYRPQSVMTLCMHRCNGLKAYIYIYVSILSCEAISVSHLSGKEERSARHGQQIIYVISEYMYSMFVCVGM